MRKYPSLIYFIFIFTIGCETQIQDISMDENQTEKKEIKSDAVKQETKNDKIKVDATAKLVPTKKVIPKVKEVPTTPIKQEKITRAVQPTFSEELLKAVQNWKKIPKSVFPLKNVSINEDVSLKLLNSAGEVIAESKMESGREVVVKSINGQSLLVSPTLASNLKGEINLDKTDFKQSVAFRFEMGKKIIEMRKRLKEQKEKGTTGVNSVGGKQEDDNTVQTSDLLAPGDFGHGKFCICSECREKRLALTGSMK